MFLNVSLNHPICYLQQYYLHIFHIIKGKARILYCLLSFQFYLLSWVGIHFLDSPLLLLLCGIFIEKIFVDIIFIFCQIACNGSRFWDFVYYLYYILWISLVWNGVFSVEGERFGYCCVICIWIFPCVVYLFMLFHVLCGEVAFAVYSYNQC